MKHPWILGLAIIALIAIAVGAYVLISAPKQPAIKNPDGTPSILFPGTGSSDVLSSEPITITTFEGGAVEVRNFIENGVTEQDPANPGTYYLAGESGYCDEQGNCVEGAASEKYTIVYFSTEGAFSIALLNEPLGEARREAERFLRNQLGISEKEMCSLNYYLSTDSYTSEQYAGSNLGFSFCPGATPLP